MRFQGTIGIAQWILENYMLSDTLSISSSHGMTLSNFVSTDTYAYIFRGREQSVLGDEATKLAFSLYPGEASPCQRNASALLSFFF